MLLYYSAWSKPVKWAVIYMCVLRVSMFASFYVFLSIGILEQIQQCGNFFVFHWVEHMSIVLQSQVKIVLLVRFIFKSVVSCYKVYFSVSSYVPGDNYEVSMISGKLYNERNVGLKLGKTSTSLVNSKWWIATEFIAVLTARWTIYPLHRCGQLCWWWLPGEKYRMTGNHLQTKEHSIKRQQNKYTQQSFCFHGGVWTAFPSGSHEHTPGF